MCGCEIYGVVLCIRVCVGRLLFVICFMWIIYLNVSVWDIILWWIEFVFGEYMIEKVLKCLSLLRLGGVKILFVLIWMW